MANKMAYKNGRLDDATPGSARDGLTINFAGINTLADLQAILAELQENAEYGLRSGGKIALLKPATQAMADRLGMGDADVLERRDGREFAPAEGEAALQLLDIATDRLLKAARRAGLEGAGSADVYVFRRLLAIAYAVEAMAIGATEAASQALQDWPYRPGPEQTAFMQRRLDAAGGAALTATLAQRIVLLAENSADAPTLNRTVRHAVSVATPDDVRTVWFNGLLAPSNVSSADAAPMLAEAMEQMTESDIAGKIARLIGSDGVAIDQMAAAIHGLVAAQWDVFILAGLRITAEDTAPLRDRDSEVFNLDRAGGPARAVDLVAHALRIPAKALDSRAGLLHAIGYRMALHATAYRCVVQPGETSVAEAIRTTLDDPPQNLHLADADAALYADFSAEASPWRKTLRRLRGEGGTLSPLLFAVPYLCTPEAVARASFERTPLAPLLAQWRAELTAGAAERDFALARMAIAAAMMAMASELSMRMLLLREGDQTYRIRVGSGPLFDPRGTLGAILAFVADFWAALDAGDVDPDDVAAWDRVMAGGIAAIAPLAGSKAGLTGFADFARAAVVDWDGEATAAALGAKLDLDVASIAALDAMRAELPVLAARSTPRRDLWGEAPAGRYDQPIAIEREMLKQGADQKPIGKKTSFAGAAVNFRDWPQAYDEYRRLAGNALKDPKTGLGAKDFLEGVVTGRHAAAAAYRTLSDGPDGGKAVFIKHTIHQYRALAQDQIMRDPKFKDFQAYVRNTQATQQAIPPAGGR